MSYGTPYTETEAILAAQAGETARVRELIAVMLPGERESLRQACMTLVEEFDRADRRSCRDRG